MLSWFWFWELFSMTLSLCDLSNDFWSLTDNDFLFYNEHDIIIFLCVNSFSKYSIWPSNVFTSSRLLSPDGVGSEYPLFILALCFMKHCSKTNDFNSFISVSSSRKLDLNSSLRLGVASIRGASGVNYIWGFGVLRINSESSLVCIVNFFVKNLPLVLIISSKASKVK